MLSWYHQTRFYGNEACKGHFVNWTWIEMEGLRCYKCLLCPSSFLNYKRLHHHVSYGHHSPRKTAYYGACNNTFKSLPSLIVHTLYYCEPRPECLTYFDWWAVLKDALSLDFIYINFYVGASVKIFYSFKFSRNNPKCSQAWFDNPRFDNPNDND